MMTKRPLPKGWRWAKLGDICDVVTGSTPPRAEKKYYGGKIPWIKPDNLDITMYVENSNEYLSEAGAKVARLLPAGSVLVSCIGNVGKIAIAGCALTTNQQINSLIPKDSVDSGFLYYACRQIKPQLISAASTALLPILNKSRFSAFDIPLPPLEEQKRIAARLDEQMRHIEQARLAAEESLSAAWELPSAYLREVFEGKEARHWETKFIKDLAETGSGATPLRSRQEYYKNGNIPWVKTGELKDRFIEDAEEHVTEIAIKETSLRLFPANTLLIAMYGQGQTRGRTSIITKPMTTNQACFAILPNEHFNTEYLQMWFQYSYDRLRRETEGRGGNQPNLNGIVLRNQEVPLPDLDIQEQIVAKVKIELSEVRALTTSLESQLAEIESLPSAVLGQAFAGQL